MATPDLADLLDRSGVPWEPNRWGIATITLPDGEHKIRATEDDGTFFLTVLSGGRAELIHSEARFSGLAAQAMLLAALDQLVDEL